MAGHPVLGLVRIGTVDLALAAEQIQEIVRGPVRLSPFPRAPRHVLGAFALRGQPVPVVDLAPLIQPAAEVAPARPVAYAVVLRHAAGRIAVQVDEVRGVRTVAPGCITALETQGAGGLFSQVYTPPDGSAVVPLLELDRLQEIDGVPVARSAADAERDRAAAGPATLLVTCRAGGITVAVPAAAVQQVLKHPGRLDSPLENALLEGFHRFRHGMAPVVRLAALLQLGASRAPAAPRHLLVLGGQDRSAAVTVDELLAIERIDAATVKPLAGLKAAPASPLLAGSYVSGAAGAVLVLDPGRALAEIHCGDTRAPTGPATGTMDGGTPRQDPAERVHFLVFHCGVARLAVPLLELDSVMELPKDMVALGGAAGALTGIGTRYGQPVHLIDLATALGLPRSEKPPPTIVLCVRSPSGYHGLLVDRAESLHLTVGEPFPRPGATPRIGPAFAHLIRGRHEGRPFAAPVLSLLDLVRGCGEAPAQRAA